MKFFIRIFLLLPIVFLTDCSKSNGPTVAPISMVGKWTVTSLVVTGCKNSASNYSQAFGCPGTISKWCYVYTFNANGTCTIERTASSTETDNGTYSIAGNWISITFSGSNEAWNFALTTSALTFTLPDLTGTGCVYTMQLTK